MKVFRLDSAQMRRLFKFFVLTLLFGLIQCQNSIQFNDKNNYDYEYGSNHLIDGYDEPKKIGELEFDVEVAEETPKPGENIPEIVVDNVKKSFKLISFQVEYFQSLIERLFRRQQR